MGRTSSAWTSAPSSASIATVAAPIPDAAPVTITRLPSYENGRVISPAPGPHAPGRSAPARCSQLYPVPEARSWGRMLRRPREPQDRQERGDHARQQGGADEPAREVALFGDVGEIRREVAVDDVELVGGP